MRHLKVNHILVVLLLSAAAAFATGKQANAIGLCTTIPAGNGPSINDECPYSPGIQCCYIAAGSSSQYVVQTQGGLNVIIRRSTSSMVTIFGVRQ